MMMRKLVTVFVLGATPLFVAPVASPGESWNRAGAASYLDARAALWTTRSRTRQNLPTACISCHTAMPYLLSRAAIGEPLPEAALALFSDVETRVSHWEDARVWYDAKRGADKPEQSRDTESVMNALVLTRRDAALNRPLSAEARSALDAMWARQNADGGWSWLYFGLGPWETDGSDYWGAALASLAAMSAGGEAHAPAENQERLRGFLRSGLTRELSLHNRLALLWAASQWSGLLSKDERARLADDVLGHQRPDGGFRLMDLGPWVSKDGTPLREESDGYATAFSTFVLEQLGDARFAPSIERGLGWLVRNQRPDGRWETLSPNKDRSGEEDFTRLLSSDAATAFAVLALTAPTGDRPKPSTP
jgi:squalene-hopene/tetraprenyl-beta-curcumene cyclase